MLEFIYKILIGHKHRYGEVMEKDNITDEDGDKIGRIYTVQCQVCGKIRGFKVKA